MSPVAGLVQRCILATALCCLAGYGLYKSWQAREQETPAERRARLLEYINRPRPLRRRVFRLPRIWSVSW